MKKSDEAGRAPWRRACEVNLEASLTASANDEGPGGSVFPRGARKWRSAPVGGGEERFFRSVLHPAPKAAGTAPNRNRP